MNFKIVKGTLIPIKEKPFKLEKDLQDMFERNLELLLNLTLVKSEFTIKTLNACKKIDTLAFDPKRKAFAIIEYKRDKHFSVFDQGVCYLNLMLQNKGEFISEYNELMLPNLKRSGINWDKSRVIFVAAGFTETQVTAADFRDIPIGLCRVKQYENGMVSIDVINKSPNAAGLKPVNGTGAKRFKTDAVYTEEFHLAGKPEKIKKLYEAYKCAILKLASGAEIKVKRHEIGFCLNRKGIKKIFCDIAPQREKLRMWINMKQGTLRDPRKLACDVSDHRHWGSGDYEIRISDAKNMGYVIRLIKQSLSKS